MSQNQYKIMNMVSNTTNFQKMSLLLVFSDSLGNQLNYEEALPYFIVTHVKEKFLNDFGNDKGRHFQ